MPRPSKPPSPELGGREKILAAAIRSFADNGYEGTTTAGVARAAGVTQPLVHRHFESKEGLWYAAMDQVFADVRLFTAPDPTLPPLEAIQQALAGFVRLSSERPEVHKIILREGSAKSERLAYLVDRYLREQFREVVDLLRAAQNEGLIDATVRPELLLFLVLGAGSHLFSVSPLAKSTVGIDARSDATREAFASLLLTVMTKGVVLQRKGTK
jgi:AcrR family transcriptional regulator